MKEPTVDVIIPTYKPNEKQFMELIDCLEKQTYPVHKIIIMNTEERYFSSLVYGNRFEMEHNVSITHISKMEFDPSKSSFFIASLSIFIPSMHLQWLLQ